MNGLSYAIPVWCLVGIICGWLESRRTGAGRLPAIVNVLACVLGAVGIGIAFRAVGELGMPWQGPIYSAFIGASCAAVVASQVSRLVKI